MIENTANYGQISQSLMEVRVATDPGNRGMSVGLGSFPVVTLAEVRKAAWRIAALIAAGGFLLVNRTMLPLQRLSPEAVGSGAVRRKGSELTMASTSAENR